MHARIKQVGLEQIPAPVLGSKYDEFSSDAVKEASQVPELLLIGFAYPYRTPVPHNLKKEEAD
jgi:hypothetical protein